MGLIITSPSTVTRPGLYFLAQQPPASVVATGTGIACITCQMPWGPSQSIFSPSSIGNLINTFAPSGMNRLGSGYLNIIQKGWPQLKVIRIEGSSATVSTVTISSVTPTALFSVTGKYPGSAGNAITVTIAAASNGNSSAFNMSVSVTGTSGTTVDFFPNLSAAGGVISGYTAAQLSNAYLTGTITWIANGNPAIGTSTMASGTDGTIAAADYVGTLGTTNKGLALMEGDLTISHKFFDDMGPSLRAACNAGMLAHVNSLSSSFGYINGPSGNSATAAQADVVTYQSDFLVYSWPWTYEYDDVTGALQFLPPSCWTASVAAQTASSTRLAARDPSITQFLSGIQQLEFNAGANAPNNTAVGITSIIQNPKGGYTFELDVVTNLPQNPAQGDLPTWRMAVYVAAALQNSLQSFVNGPNVSVTQDSLNTAVSDFMDQLVQQQSNDPLHNVYLKAWAFGNFASYNTPASVDAGNYYIPLNFQTDAGMQKIFVAATFGPTVSISVSQTSPS